MKANINKEEILQGLDIEQCFIHYLGPYFGNKSPKAGVNISNPYLSEKQKSPSFNFYRNPDGDWRYKDFATEDQGDIIDLVMRLKNCEFQDALKLLRGDVPSIRTSKKLDFQTQEWNDCNSAYWKGYSIPISILSMYDVICLSHYRRLTKEEKEIAVNSSQKEPVFAYKINSNCLKIYAPLSKMKFSWLGVKPVDYVFGEKQLPNFCNRIYITAGEKDVLSLAAKGEHAVCFNSETSMPSDETILRLKNRTNELIVLYDNDDTGRRQAEKLARSFDLGRIMIPDQFLSENEKDISDVLKKGVDFLEISKNVERFNSKDVFQVKESIKQILKTKERIKQKVSEVIIRPNPIIKLKDVGVIYPRTINIIQGKAGVHKSRLAETICSALIARDASNDNFLGFKRDPLSRPKVCYIDTERNLNDQFPAGLQQIISKAGFEKGRIPDSLDYASILEFKREERFQTVNDYLEYIRETDNGQLVIVLDVITDCIRDFNRSDDSMQLIDLMNSAINDYDVTFIALIHENPGLGEKARGHLGTELMNKASTVIQIGFERNKSGKATELIAVNFLKTRASRKPDSLFLKFCEAAKGLVHAQQEDINEVIYSRQVKADTPQVIKYLEENYKEKYANAELLAELEDEFVCSDKIIRERLKEIIDKKYVIMAKEQAPKLLVRTKEGTSVFYSFVNA